ncbi:MAG: hypothetical protein WBA27_07435, partial [Pseudomonas neustonica]
AQAQSPPKVQIKLDWLNPAPILLTLAACSLQLAACSLQLAACSLQLAACSLQLAACIAAYSLALYVLNKTV